MGQVIIFHLSMSVITILPNISTNIKKDEVRSVNSIKYNDNIVLLIDE